MLEEEHKAGEEAEEKVNAIPLWRVLGPSIAGSILEWMDFSVFAFFAKQIGKLFFVAQDSRAQIIKAFSVYAGGFLVRPLGSLLFGMIGDHYGTARALQVSIFAMAIPTFVVGLLPTYAQIGLAAPALLTALRLLQGLCVGGEIVGSVLYTVENTPKRSSGFYGGLMLGMALLGIFVGSAMATLLHHFLTKAQLLKWGWRVPFLLGLLVGVVGFLIRSVSMHPPHVRNARPAGMTSIQAIGAVFRNHWKEVAESAAIASLYHAGFYMCCVFIGTYMAELTSKPFAGDVAFGVASWALVIHIISVPAFGLIADKHGRNLVMGIGGTLLGLSAPFLFILLNRGDVWTSVAATSALSILVGMWGGPLFGWIIHNNTSAAPMTAVGLAYNIAAALFGGTASLVGTLLASKAFPAGPGCYISGVSLLSVTTLLYTHVVKERKDDLDFGAQELEKGEQGVALTRRAVNSI